MTKLKRLGSGPKPFNTVRKLKTKNVDEIKAQRLAMLAKSRAESEKSVIILPNGKQSQDTEATSIYYFGMAMALAWVLGEENLPMREWSMPQ